MRNIHAMSDNCCLFLNFSLCLCALAGADIKEMSEKTYMEAYKMNMLAMWQNITSIRKPGTYVVFLRVLFSGCL